MKSSIKSRVWGLLDKNPLLTAKYICAILKLSYDKYSAYVRNLKSSWKRNTDLNKVQSVHGWRGFTYLPEFLLPVLDLKRVDVREKILGLGWRPTKARNRWILWRDKLGRLQWFETGRINLYVRAPATLGKAFQLVSNGFGMTEIITDIRSLEVLLKGIRFKSAHYVFKTSQRLPQVSISMFNKSNGIIIKVGDRTHPNALEVIASYPDWGEYNERALSKLTAVLEKILPSPSKISEKKDIGFIV